MNCPKCDTRTYVLESDARKDGTVRRRRVCRACEHRFTTLEEWVPGRRGAAPKRDTADRVPNAQLRDAVAAACAPGTDLSHTALAAMVGLTRDGGRGDVTALKRAVGLVATPTKSRGVQAKHFNRRIDYDLALRIADSIGADPVDVGL